MKYLRLHPINEDRNWILSKKEDIIECSYDLTDLPYDFYYCGRIKEGEDLSSYLSFNLGGYSINYDGSVEVDDSNEDYINWTGYISGVWDGEFIFDKNCKDYDDKPRYKELVDSILPSLEDVIIKLRGTVFNEGDFMNSFHIYCYDLEQYYDDDSIIMVNVKIMFKKK